MKNKRLILCGFLGVLLAAVTPACGQGTKNVLKNISKGFRMNASQITESLPNASAQMSQVAGAAAMAVPSVSVPVIKTDKIAAKVNHFIINHKQAIFRAQRAVGISPRQAVANMRHLGIPPTHKPPFPKPNNTQGFIVHDFTDLAYESGELPASPFAPHPHYMYRGLGLSADGSAVRNILENGLLIKDVGPDHNTLRLSYASHMGRGALQTIASQPVINLTNSPTVALHYAKRYQAKGMLVLVVVKEKQNHKKIITTPEDIPASDIQTVAAVLSVHGQPTWCQIELAEDGFLVTPYTR